MRRSRSCSRTFPYGGPPPRAGSRTRAALLYAPRALIDSAVLCRGAAADLDPPGRRSFLQVAPREFALVLGVELVVERQRIMIIDEHERLTRFELGVGLEYLSVPISRNQGTYVEHLGF